MPLTEQCICVTCYKIGKTAKEAYDSLKVAFGDKPLS
jgi:hypothetical protein